MSPLRDRFEWVLVILTAPVAAFAGYSVMTEDYFSAILAGALFVKGVLAYLRMPDAFFRQPGSMTRQELMTAFLNHRASHFKRYPFLRWIEDFCTYLIVFGAGFALMRLF